MATYNQGMQRNTTPGGPGGGMARSGQGTGGGQTGTGRGYSTNTLVTTVGSFLPEDGVLTPVETQVTLTQGYFSNGAGLLQGSNIHTGTLADVNEKYYFNVTNTHPLSSSAETQFSVTFGHRGGSGSVVLSGNETPTLKGETEAIYKQFASLVLKDHEITGGLKIGHTGLDGPLAAGQPDDYIYALVTNRDRYKDALDTKSWTIKLSGSMSDLQSGSTVISLTDDSDSPTNTDGVTQTIAGPRYNIVSGAAGNVYTASTSLTYGHYYPHMGLMLFSGATLSASIPGDNNIGHITASFSAEYDDAAFLSSSGFTPNLFDDGNPKNALKFVNCLRNIDDEDIRLRSSQEQEKRSYFCTVLPNQCNFSTNPTFISGSTTNPGLIRHASMRLNPTVYITGLGLHHSDGTLLAVAKLSTPIQKNFGTQQTIKVNLTY